MLPDLQIVEHPEGAIAYRRAGSGPPMLFLHGLGGASASWRCQFDGLADRFTVIAWDAPGYGGSARRLATADSYADAAATLIEVVDLGPATVVGHSLGGIIAGRLAARRPDRVARLALSCTFLGDGPSAMPAVGGFQARVDERQRMDDADFGRARAAGMTAPDVAPQVFDEVAAIAGSVRLGGLEDGVAILAISDNRAFLCGLEMPILVIEAERDRVISAERTAEMRAALPAHRHVVLPGVGHAPYLEDPDRFDSTLRAFVDGR